jgi:hypothetical protein
MYLEPFDVVGYTHYRSLRLIQSHAVSGEQNRPAYDVLDNSTVSQRDYDTRLTKECRHNAMILVYLWIHMRL